MRDSREIFPPLSRRKSGVVTLHYSGVAAVSRSPSYYQIGSTRTRVKSLSLLEKFSQEFRGHTTKSLIVNRSRGGYSFLRTDF